MKPAYSGTAGINFFHYRQVPFNWPTFRWNLRGPRSLGLNFFCWKQVSVIPRFSLREVWLYKFSVSNGQKKNVLAVTNLIDEACLYYESYENRERTACQNAVLLNVRVCVRYYYQWTVEGYKPTGNYEGDITVLI